MRTTLRAVGKNPAAPNRDVAWLNTHPKYANKPISMREHLRRIRNVVESARALGDLPERIPHDGAWENAEPVVSDQEEIRDDPLHTSQGERIMPWIRAQKRYSIDDVLWTLVWRYGLRVPAIRALDRDHVVFEPHEADDWPAQHEFYPHLQLRDRPELGGKEDEAFPLKNTNPVYAERLIPLNDEDAESIRGYVDRGTPTGATKSRKVWEEYSEPDKYGFFGLITSTTPRGSRRRRSVNGFTQSLVRRHTQTPTVTATAVRSTAPDTTESTPYRHNGESTAPGRAVPTSADTELSRTCWTTGRTMRRSLR